jgi:nitrogen fixation NifU-like protein
VLTDDTVSSQYRNDVGKLKLFEGVKNFPIRVKCATLAWRTLEAALSHPDQTVTTE